MEKSTWFMATARLLALTAVSLMASCGSGDMRTLDATQTAVHDSTHRSHHLKVSVKLSSTWYDLSSLQGFNFIESAEISDHVDNPTMTAKVTLKQRHGLLSLWSEDSNSQLNNLSGSYDPLIFSNREVKIETATLPSGVDPIASDWVSVFEGRIAGEIATSNGKIAFNCLDKSADLMRIFIETQTIYGSTSGSPLETEMQQILTDNSTGVTLYTPTSPSWNVKEWIQQREPVATALRRLAQQIGWECKYRWDSGTSAWRLTLYQPPRSKTTPDYTFSSDDNLIWDKRPSINDANIRNVVKVIYTDAFGQSPTPVTVTDATSISTYGRRYMEIQEDSASNIDTSTEASAMANAILSDLKDPVLNVPVESSYLWFVETGDLYRFPADDYNWTANKDLAVVGFTHKLTPTSARTSLTMQGRVIGAYEIWLQKEARPGNGKTYDEEGPVEKWRITRKSSREGIGSINVSPESSQRGIAQNSDFGYQGRAIATNPPDSWEVVTGTWGTSGDIYVDTTVVKSTSRSLRYTSNAGASVVLRSDYIPVVAGSKYIGTLWARTDNVSGATNVLMQLEFYDETKTLISTQTTVSYQFTSTGVWVQPRPNLAAAATGDTYCRIKITLTNASTKKIYLDSVFLKEVCDQYLSTGSQSIPDATITPLNLTGVTYDYYSGHVITGSYTYWDRQQVGTYVIIAGVYFDTLAAGDEVDLYVEGRQSGGAWGALSWASGVAGARGEVKLNVTLTITPTWSYEEIRASVWQNSGVAKSTVANVANLRNTYLNIVQTEDFQ